MAKIPLRVGPVELLEADLRQLYVGLRQKQQLETVLNSIRVFSAAAERKLRGLLRKKLLTDPTVAAQFQYQQGRLDGIAEVLVAIDRWSQPAGEKKGRPDA